jgi:glycosyltransferase involved in cell wall biosynthesis
VTSLHNLRALVRDPRMAARLVTRRAIAGPLVDTPLRAAARRRKREPASVSVVIVGWNSADYLLAGLYAVRKFTPDPLEIVVVDNGSDDDSCALARSFDAKLIRLPMNVGHGPAAQVGMLAARGEHLVVLDVDAFPLSHSWLDELLDPLRDGAVVNGAHLHRRYAHPCCLAIRAEHFVVRGHTMLASYDLGKRSLRAQQEHAPWDVGELVSIREQPRVHLIEATEKRGPGDIGMVFGNIVYHNAYSTRHRAQFPAGEGEIDTDRITALDATTAWAEATTRFLGMTPAELRETASSHSRQA